MASVNSVVKAIKSILDGVKNNKVRNFSYSNEAYTNNDVDGVPSFDINNPQNIPDGSHVELDEAVINTGLRTKATSLPRMFINHFFGRISYNLNKLADTMSALIDQITITSGIGFDTYNADTDYATGAQVKIQDASQAITTGTTTRFFFRSSSGATFIKGVPPIDGAGVVNTTNWTEVLSPNDISNRLAKRTATNLNANTLGGIGIDRIIFGDTSLGTTDNGSGDVGLLLKTGVYRSSAGSAGLPTSDGNTYLINHWQHPTMLEFAHQMAKSMSNAETTIYIRNKVAGVWNAWSKQWNENNDGYTSGLTAQDTLTFEGLTRANFSQVQAVQTGDINLNTLTTNGIYKIQKTTATSMLGLNYPEAQVSPWSTGHFYGVLEVSRSEFTGENRLIQRLYANSAGNAWQRMYNSSWGAWEKILTTANTSNFIFGSNSYGTTRVTDANAITKSGFYLSTTSNNPTPSIYYITHLNTDADATFAEQKATMFNDPLMTYIRIKNSNVWSAWSRICTEANKGFTSLVPDVQSAGVGTPVPAANLSRLARITLSAQWSSAQLALAINHLGVVSHAQNALLDFEIRVRQEAAFGGNPMINAIVTTKRSNPEVFSSVNICYVIVQNTPTTIIDIFVKINVAYTSVSGIVRASAASSNAGIAVYKHHALVAHPANLVILETGIDWTSLNVGDNWSTALAAALGTGWAEALVKPIDVTSVPLLAHTLKRQYVPAYTTVAVGNVPVGTAFDGTHIWVANSSSSNVSKISIVTNTVVATVVVGAEPYAVAFDGTHIWVVNSLASSVSKISVVTNTVVATVAVGSVPVGIAFDGTHIWVARYTSSSSNVSKISIVTNTVVATVNVGADPYAVAFDGTHIWVANSSSSNVSKISVVTNTVVATVVVGSGPRGIAFDGTHIWVVNSLASSVSKISVVTNTVVATVAVGSVPMDIAFDGSSIWVANSNSSNISRILVEAAR